MDRHLNRTLEQPPRRSLRCRLCWACALLGLVGWQGWMTLQLFGPEQAWQRLTDDQPILTGRHPLHLYHGFLGASSLLRRASLSCYDPWFQAGYPKTPVFDSGSRPAELFLALAGGAYRPAAYKIGLAVCCCLVPWLLVVAGRGIGLSHGQAWLASALGLLVWWGGPCQALLAAGDLDLLLTVLAAVVHVGLLLHFHRSPGPLVWLGLLASGSLGWFAQPLLFTILLVPLLLLYFHSVGVRHGLSWHLALLLGVAGGLALNVFWLFDWLEYWWLRLPLPTGPRLLTHRTLYHFWTCCAWGCDLDRILALVLLGSGALGIGLFGWQRSRPTARLLALGTGGLLVLALAGMGWEPLGRLGTPRLLVPALWFAVLPAVHAWAWLGQQLAHHSGGAGRATLLAGSVLLAAGWWLPTSVTPLAQRLTRARPLSIGLDAEQQALVATLSAQTTNEARILWEDRPATACSSRWTVLLPLWTQRAFLGGLDPEANLEHGAIGLVEQQLGGRALADWTDPELEDYCRRYNLGWVVGRTPAVRARFQAWQARGLAESVATLTIDGQPAELFALRRPGDYVLKGQARWLLADCRRIVLGDVQPEDGQVILSLHYQAGMQVSPSQIRIERDPDPLDPIPLVRLRLAGPVTRVTLTWAGAP